MKIVIWKTCSEPFLIFCLEKTFAIFIPLIYHAQGDQQHAWDAKSLVLSSYHKNVKVYAVEYSPKRVYRRRFFQQRHI